MADALKVVWAAVGDKPQEITYQRPDQPMPRLGVTLTEVVSRAQVPADWAEKLWPEKAA